MTTLSASDQLKKACKERGYSCGFLNWYSSVLPPLGPFIFTILLGISVLLTQCVSKGKKPPLTLDLKDRISQRDGNAIGLKAFFGPVNWQQVKISPEGQFLAVLAGFRGHNALYVMTRDLKKVMSRHDFIDRDVRDFQWLNRDRLALEVSRQDADNGDYYGYNQLYLVSFDGGQTDDFFAQSSAQFELLQWLPRDPNHILLQKTERNSGETSVLRFNIYNGLSEVLVPARQRGSFFAGPEGRVSLYSQSSQIKSEPFNRLNQVSYFDPDLKSWRQLSYPSLAKSFDSFYPLDFDSQSKRLLVASTIETGRLGIYQLDLKTGKKVTVFEHPTLDFSGVVFDQGHLAGVCFDDGRQTCQAIGRVSKKMLLYQNLKKVFPDQAIADITLTSDDREATFRVWSDRNPGDFYLVDLVSNRIRYLASVRPEIDPKLMRPMNSIKIPTRDGENLAAYLTLPAVRPQQGVALIVIPHGGPYGRRDWWGFRSEVQFFANRGYGVLQVNYRGSGGYGVAFLRNGYRHWGALMQDDLTDATRWLVKQKIADPQRLSIYGASYGGYAALMATIREPELYRCAISLSGVYDLRLLFTHGDTQQFELGRNFLKTVHGDDIEDLKDRSPRYLASRIKVPVFLIHGSDDVRVPVKHYQVMIEQLKAHQKTFETLLKQGEGHGFTHPENRYEAYFRMLDFLDRQTAIPRNHVPSLLHQAR